MCRDNSLCAKSRRHVRVRSLLLHSTINRAIEVRVVDGIFRSQICVHACMCTDVQVFCGYSYKVVYGCTCNDTATRIKRKCPCRCVHGAYVLMYAYMYSYTADTGAYYTTATTQTNIRLFMAILERFASIFGYFLPLRILKT